MKNITHKQFSILGDCPAIFDFMTEIYERDWRNGVAAPFFEYAYASFDYWMNISYCHKNRIWKDGDKIVGFCFSESPVTDTYFSLRPGYEELAGEMVAYADASMPGGIEDKQFILFDGQTALIEAAKALGYKMVYEWTALQIDFDKRTLDYPLPEGFRFVPFAETDMEKHDKCCWKGFDHEEKEGPWESAPRDECSYHIAVAPHATPELNVTIEDEATGEYVCYAGMWWVPANHLAYMEPLCTVPEYRHRGLAAAAISEHYRRLKSMGATHMTGGDDPFYEKIGYEPAVHWTHWKKTE